MKKKYYLLIILLSSFIISCSTLQRSKQSGYANDTISNEHTPKRTGANQDPRLKKLYHDNKNFLKNSEEEAEFLSHTNYEDLISWLNKNKVYSRGNETDDIYQEFIEKKDIAYGMTESQVLASWGKPDYKEASGDAELGHHRWVYKRYLATNEGYEKLTRFIYFKSGKVVGWQQD